MDVVRSKWGCEAVIQPDLSPDDYVLIDRHPIALAEVKRREIPFGTIERPECPYDDIILSKRKVLHVARSCGESGLPFLFIVGFDDYIRWTVLFHPLDGLRPMGEKTGGRCDRGDPLDEEVVFLVPIRWFRDLSVSLSVVEFERKIRIDREGVLV